MPNFRANGSAVAEKNGNGQTNTEKYNIGQGVPKKTIPLEKSPKIFKFKSFCQDILKMFSQHIYEVPVQV